MQQHEHVPRFTTDIDLLVPGEQVGAALTAVETCGFDLRAAPLVFGAGTPSERHVRRVSKADAGRLLTLDLVLVEPGFGDVWSSRVLVEWEGRTLPWCRSRAWRS